MRMAKALISLRMRTDQRLGCPYVPEDIFSHGADKVMINAILSIYLTLINGESQESPL